MDFPMRINKYLAHQGESTRRGADELIKKGLVFVNGKPALMGQQIGEDDVVEVRGPRPEYTYILYNKPRGIISHSPAKGETDIVTRLKTDHHITGVAPVGRLDKDSEGLIILTNDGRITARLLDQKHAHERAYAVSVDKNFSPMFIRLMSGGVQIERYKTKPATVAKIGDGEFSIVLTEGKKHQIRRMCAALGYQVVKLVRTRILNLELKGLGAGQYRVLKGMELKNFLTQLGLSS